MTNHTPVVKKDMPSLESILSLIAKDMSCVDVIIEQQLHSRIELIDLLSHYIINSGGKRLRPALLLLSARVFSYNGDVLYQLAAIIEFIHTATLLHDDVVDASLLRRGKVTANQCWGNEASVLVGDFLYSRAFQMMVSVGSMQVMSVLADTTNIIAGGEVKQLEVARSLSIDEQTCLQVIRNKTASLFRAAAQLGAVISRQPAKIEQTMACYGEYLGMAFQLVDDVLDYSAAEESFGKNICDDLAEGKTTVPLLYALRHGSTKDQEVIRQSFGHNSAVTIDAAEILAIMQRTGALEYTHTLAQKQVEMACTRLECLPASEYREALYHLAHFVVQRGY